MNLTWQQIAISIITLVGTTALTFFLKDLLQRYLYYRKLRSKLDNIAGVRASVLYENLEYKIITIDQQGIVLKSDLQTIFIPIKKALENILVIPGDYYEKVKEGMEQELHMKMKARVLDMMDDMMDQMLPKMFAKIKEQLTLEMMEDETELSMVVGMKITKILQDEGMELKKVKKPKSP